MGSDGVGGLSTRATGGYLRLPPRRVTPARGLSILVFFVRVTEDPSGSASCRVVSTTLVETGATWPTASEYLR